MKEVIITYQEVIDMSEENLKKLKEFKKNLEERENREKEISEFIKVFMDYYYQDYKLAFDNLENIYNIIVLLLDKIEDFVFSHTKDDVDNYLIDFDIVEKLGIGSKLLILKDFYKKINQNIDIDSLVNNGTFSIEAVMLEDERSYDLIFSGLCNEYSPKVEIKVHDTGLVMDLFSWVHEIAHYSNYVSGKNEVNLLLTESISHTYEMLLINYLANSGYNYEASSYQFESLRNFYSILYQAYYVIKLYIVYDKLGDISIENYKTIFGYDEDYDDCLDVFYNTINKKLTAIISLINYTVAAALSPYMYYRWEKDSSFMENILKFNESIMNKPLDACLNDIGLTGFDKESIEKIIEAIESFKNEIINGNDYVIAKCAMANDYFKGFEKLYADEKDMIFKNIDDIVDLITYLKKELVPFFKDTYPNLDINKLSKAKKKEKISIIRDYYKYMGYDFDFDNMLKFANIKKYNLNSEIEEEPFALLSYALVGNNDDNGNNHNEININDTSYLLDTAAWVHEFRHFNNYPGCKRSEKSFILSECVSFAEELMYADYLDKIGYSYESAFIKFETFNNFYIFVLDAYPLNVLLSCYVNMGKVSKVNFEKQYTNGSYFDDVLNDALPLLQNDTDDYINGIRYSVACAISIYMYEEYKKDKNYIKTINEFEKHINDGDFYGCLKIIGINGLDSESLGKITMAFNEFKKELNGFINNDVINMYDMNYQKVIKRIRPI